MLVSCVYSTVADLDLVSYVFNDFGKNFVKSQKLSPDAFIQLAFQYTYHRSVSPLTTILCISVQYRRDVLNYG